MMILLALMALAARPQTGQVLAGKDFEPFAKATDRACPRRRLRFTTPGDLSWQQESFADELAAAARARLAAADRGARCCTGPGGLACPTVATLGALRRTGLLRAFGQFACTHPAPGGARIARPG